VISAFSQFTFIFCISLNTKACASIETFLG